jgi:hypothetical protein
MSVEVKNGVSILRSSNGNAVKFKGSEDAPVLFETQLEDCSFVGTRDASASRARLTPRQKTFLIQAPIEVGGTVVSIGSEGTFSRIKAISAVTLRPFASGASGNDPEVLSVTAPDADAGGPIPLFEHGNLAARGAEEKAQMDFQFQGVLELTVKATELATGLALDPDKLYAPTPNGRTVEVEIVDTTPSLLPGAHVRVYGYAPGGEAVYSDVAVAAGTFETGNVFARVTSAYLLNLDEDGLDGGGDETLELRFTDDPTSTFYSDDITESFGIPTATDPFEGRALLTVYYDEYEIPSFGTRPDVESFTFYGLLTTGVTPLEGVDLVLFDLESEIEGNIVATTAVDGTFEIPRIYVDRSLVIREAGGDADLHVPTPANPGTAEEPIEVISVPA